MTTIAPDAAAAPGSKARPTPAEAGGANLPRSVLATFSGPCLPLAALGLPLVVQLPPYYANHVGLPLATVGLVFMMLRFADIAVDPVLGAMMDATRTRWGRFRPWFAASTPILMLGAWFLFMVKPGASAWYLIGWLGFLYIGWSMAILSHGAWGARLSANYHERSRIYAWWQGANILGMILVLLLPAIVEMRAGSAVHDPSPGIQAMGWFIVVLLPLTIALAVWRTPEPQTGSQVHHKVGLSTYVDLIRRRAVARILAVDLTASLAGGATGALFLFFFRFAKGYSPGEANLLLLIYFIGGLAGAPLWTYLAKRIGKHRALAANCLFPLISIPVILVMPEQMAIAAPLMLFCGLNYASASILIRAMTADAGDENRLDTGAERTGVLYSLINSTSKIAYALSVGITYPLLGAFGFDAKLGEANTPEALRGLTLVFALSPIVASLFGAWAMLGYKLDATRHAGVRAALEARDAA